MVFTYTFLHTRKWLYYSTHAYSSSIVVGIVVKLMGGRKKGDCSISICLVSVHFLRDLTLPLHPSTLLDAINSLVVN